SIIAAIVLVASGGIQNFHGLTTVHTLAGGTQSIPGGPVASQEVIKQLGTNGGGFYNANSAHGFENPNPFSNIFLIFLMLLIPFTLPRTFGRMVKDNRQGYAIVSVMAAFWIASVVLISFFESQHSGTASTLAGAGMEGKETRFGIAGSSLFAASSTLT